MKLIILFFAFVCASSFGYSKPSPNVVLITIDDLNDWVGALDTHPYVKTPNLDRLAEYGILYTNAHAQATVCNPSRTSFLTGLRPTTSRIYSLDADFRDNPDLANHPTIHQTFKKAGYSTYSTGKVYHLPNAPQDEAAATFGYSGNYGPTPPTKYVDTPNKHPLLDWGPLALPDTAMPDWKVADFAIQQIENQASDRPMFITVGFWLPHVPFCAPQKWFDLYSAEEYATPDTLPAYLENDRDDCPHASWYLHWDLPEPRLKFLKESHTWTSKVHAYLACISYVDSQVGRVLDAIESSEQADNTIICLLSDHGYHLGEKDISGKNSLWDRSTRVPLILAGPNLPKNIKNASAVELLDVYPTLAELAGISVDAKLDGSPLPFDTTLDPARTAITSSGPYNQTIRTSTHRYIRYLDGSEELYDYTSDPYEHVNLAQNPSQASLKSQLKNKLIQNPAEPLPNANSRLSTLVNGVPTWEGAPIHSGDPIPGL
ncbi:sulfatase [Coraliomargarita sp. W4R53]